MTTTQNTTASGAADRVNAYLDRRATMRSVDPEVVHGMDGVDFELTVSDLRALAASAPVAPTGWRLLKDSTTAERSWDEDTADGIYFNECVHCGRGFTGYKRRVVCKVCFSNPAPQAAPVAPTQPDWRELCRRLYVELFHCDKQMTGTLNEMGDPMWRTGAEVRDVLSDAKAALEANPTTPEAAPVAPAPQPAPMPYPTDAQVDAVYEQTMGQHLRSQDAPAVRRFGRAMFLCAWNAAAPKADPIPGAGKMLGDLLARIHGDGGHYASEHGIEKAVADADRILAEWRAYKPAPLQQGEYLPLPIGEGTVYCNPDGSLMIDASLAFFDGAKIGDKLYTADQVCAAVDADRAARGAAQAAPAEPDMRSVALAAGAYTTAYSMLTHAKVHNADVDGSTKRLVAAINGLRSALGQPAPVAGYVLRLEGTDMDAERRKMQHYDDPFVMPPQETKTHD